MIWPWPAWDLAHEDDDLVGGVRALEGCGDGKPAEVHRGESGGGSCELAYGRAGACYEDRVEMGAPSRPWLRALGRFARRVTVGYLLRWTRSHRGDCGWEPVRRWPRLPLPETYRAAVAP